MLISYNEQKKQLFDQKLEKNMKTLERIDWVDEFMMRKTQENFGKMFERKGKLKDQLKKAKKSLKNLNKKLKNCEGYIRKRKN